METDADFLPLEASSTPLSTSASNNRQTQDAPKDASRKRKRQQEQEQQLVELKRAKTNQSTKSVKETNLRNRVTFGVKRPSQSNKAAQNAKHIVFNSSSSSSEGSEEEEEEKQSDNESVEVIGDETTATKASVPWWKCQGSRGQYRSLPSQSPLLRLHQEILDFVEFIQPTSREEEIANDALATICNIIHETHAEADVQIFGSRATNLLLPSSDWDLCVYNVDPKPKLMYSLANVSFLRDGSTMSVMLISIYTFACGGIFLLQRFRAENVATSVEVITKARVPIIKMKEKQSGIPIDVSFNASSGPESSDFMVKLLQQYPAARHLVIVLKYFLLQRELNETYTGGIGSFLLTLMVVRVIQEVAFENAVAERQKQEQKKKKQEKKKNTKKGTKQSIGEITSVYSENMNLGYLLLRFFELYGCELNYVSTGVSLRGGGSFFEKKSKGWFNPGRPELLALENPMYTDVDVGKNSFSIAKVKGAFSYAYHRLATAVREWNGDYSHLSGNKNKNPTPKSGIKRKSLLGLIISEDDTLIKRADEQLFQRLLDRCEPLPQDVQKQSHMNCGTDNGFEEGEEGDKTNENAFEKLKNYSSSEEQQEDDTDEDSSDDTEDSNDDGSQLDQEENQQVSGLSDEGREDNSKKGQESDENMHNTFGIKLRKPRLIHDILSRTRNKSTVEERPSGWY